MIKQGWNENQEKKKISATPGIGLHTPGAVRSPHILFGVTVTLLSTKGSPELTEFTDSGAEAEPEEGERAAELFYAAASRRDGSAWAAYGTRRSLT